MPPNTPRSHGTSSGRSNIEQEIGPWRARQCLSERVFRIRKINTGRVNTPPELLSARGDLPGGYFPLHEDPMGRIHRPHPFHADSRTFPSLSLEAMLRGNLPRPTRKQTYTLSLILASSFLQLLDTGWLPASWTKADIVFFADPNDANAFLLDQPRLRRDPIESLPHQAQQTTAGRAVVLDRALDQLGLVLLELCFWKVIEEHACRKTWPLGANKTESAVFDVLAARMWQYEVADEAGSDYFDAVKWCLGGISIDRWRQDMLREVVQPLERCRGYLS